MNLRTDFSCSFQRVKSFFSLCPQIDIVIAKDCCTFIASRNGVYYIWIFDANLSRIDGVDLTVTQGVSIMTELLFKLPANKKGSDQMSVDIVDDLVVLNVNGYKISTNSQIFDRKSLDMIMKHVHQEESFNLRQFYWLHSVSKNYKDVTIDVINTHAFCKTPDGLYVQKLETPFASPFSFNSTFLSKAFVTPVLDSTIGMVISLTFKDTGTIMTTLYGVNRGLMEDFRFMRSLKSKVKVYLNLEEHKDLFKVLKTGQISLQIADKTLEINSSVSEQIKVFLGDNCSTSVAESKDFSRLMTITDELSNISVSSTAVLKVIANEIEGVSVYLNSIANVVVFKDSRYLIMENRV